MLTKIIVAETETTAEDIKLTALLLIKAKPLFRLFSLPSENLFSVILSDADIYFACKEAPRILSTREPKKPPVILIKLIKNTLLSP